MGKWDGVGGLDDCIPVVWLRVWVVGWGGLGKVFRNHCVLPSGPQLIQKGCTTYSHKSLLCQSPPEGLDVVLEPLVVHQVVLNFGHTMHRGGVVAPGKF